MELIDILDDFGIRTGKSLPRKEVHRTGKVHRAVHIYLFDESNNIVLQRRSNSVDHYPGMLGISAAGHLHAGEPSEEAARRELFEELGIYPTTFRFLFSHRQDAEIRPDYIDRQFNDVYVCSGDFALNDLRIQPTEVCDITLLPFDTFVQLVNSNDDSIAPVYQRECRDVVYFLRFGQHL